MGKEVRCLLPGTAEELSRYPWPGNVRELRNVVEHALILCRGEKLEIRSPAKNPLVRENSGTAAQAQHDHFLAVLERTNWRIKGAGGAAEILNLKPSTLYSMLKRLGLANRRDGDAGAS